MSVLLPPEALRWFVETGAIDEVVRVVKSGKESAIYLTRRACRQRTFHFAAKVHMPRARRSFRRDRVYMAGWYFSARDHRVERAVRQRSRYGIDVIDARRVSQEYSVLRKLWRRGANVPTLILKHGSAILMTYLGEPERPAPKLCKVSLTRREAAKALRDLVTNLKLIVNSDLVHGDLSPFNVLYWQEKVWLIDFAQAVELHRNPHSMDLLFRDLERISGYFEKHGVRSLPERLFSQVVGVRYAPGRTYQELLMVSSTT